MEEKKEVIKHVKSKEEFEKLIKGNKPVLVDFYAEWCGPCQMMGPILEEMGETYKNIDKVEIVKVDIDKLREVSRDYDVMSVPTFMIFKDGKTVQSFVGMRPQEELEGQLDKALEEK